MSLETLWICIPRCEDASVFVLSILASCIVFTGLEYKEFTFIELYMLMCMF